MKQLIASLLTAAALALPAVAQPIVITDAKLATMGPDGIIDGGTLIIEDGRITAVGRDLDIPSNARLIPGEGRWVTPGLFHAFSKVGAVEVGAVASSRDDRVDADVPFSAAFDIAYGINPNATAIPLARMEGLTRAAVYPSPAGKSVFAGLGALIVLDDRPGPVFQRRAFMHAALGEAGAAQAGSSRGGAMVSLIHAIEEAARYRDARDKDAWEGGIGRLDAAALVPVTIGDIPLVISAHRASDLLEIVELGRRYAKLDLVIAGAAEGWMVAEELAAAEIPVIIDPTENLPAGFDRLGATQRNAGRLVEAGVLVAIIGAGSDSHLPHLARQAAGNAVANGLDHEAALKALSHNPARIYGVDDQLGSLMPGRLADVVIWDGDPLEVMANPDHVFVAGEERAPVSRQSKLRDRYRNLDAALPPAYRR
ncbi:MAG: amidohydrolase family protein [Rhodothalassiaceae bacterium]